MKFHTSGSVVSGTVADRSLTYSERSVLDSGRKLDHKEWQFEEAAIHSREPTHRDDHDDQQWTINVNTMMNTLL